MRRLFSDESFWNQPIADDAESDPRSDDFIDLLGQEPSGGWHVNLHKFAIPVYEVNESTPLRTVHQMTRRAERELRFAPRNLPPGQHPDFGPQIPIPDAALPDPASDAHMACVDWDRMLAWDIWLAHIREDGEWESFTGMHYRLDGEGVWQTSDFPVVNGESIHCHGPGRAAGVPIIAGLIMREEALAGEIPHKLACATRMGAFQEFVAPATWTDGKLVGGIPEGAVIQLDPAFDLGQFDLSPAARAVARAFQTYGAVNVDCAGGTTLYGEGLYADPERSWDGLLGEDELKAIPVGHFRVLKLGPVTNMGDGRRRRTEPVVE